MKMIPEFAVDLEVNIAYSRLRIPPLSVLTEEDGLVSNHEYVDLRGIPWRQMLEVHNVESRLVRMASKATSAAHFEELVCNLEEGICDADIDISDSCLVPVDLGIMSAVAALSASGAIPVSSCRGHPGRQDAHPYVAFWASRSQARHIAAIATQSHVGIVDYPIAEAHGLMLYSTNVTTMMDFATMLYAAREQKMRARA